MGRPVHLGTRAKVGTPQHIAAKLRDMADRFEAGELGGILYGVIETDEGASILAGNYIIEGTDFRLFSATVDRLRVMVVEGVWDGETEE